ncbi:hypothetical protein HF086_017876 [Spodoptera exigua]|uniref:Uncharacterized protein n=1 Tax=Spodoptera exigua TaxID=7107 RepID=A0A922MF36_SPOEX|nr:hypothetical protein HF086_017876 [Spodoptera exigua]
MYVSVYRATGGSNTICSRLSNCFSDSTNYLLSAAARPPPCDVDAPGGSARSSYSNYDASKGPGGGAGSGGAGEYSRGAGAGAGGAAAEEDGEAQ